jgi:uroporphyrinogen decarboxylase
MVINLTRKERVQRIIDGEDVDYLPSNLVFADRTRDKEISKALGLVSENELDDYLDNHLMLVGTLHDKPLFYHSVRPEMEKLKKMGYCSPDWENKIVYDSWGLGIKVDFKCFFAQFAPLGAEDYKRAKELMPPDVNREIFGKSFEEAVKLYRTPDINKKGNFSEIENAINEDPDELFVWPHGYLGIYERAYSLVGWQKFMEYMVLKTSVIEELLEKITDYKVKVAKEKVRLGAKVGHHGDDLGTNVGAFFSKDTFRKILLPRLKRVFDVYNDANIPVWIHSCGNITEYIPDLIDIGLRILEPVQPVMDIELLKREFGKDLVFYGGIDTQYLLPYGTPEEVKTESRRTIRILGKGGGHIMGTAQEIMHDVPIENIKALVETMREERERAI